MRWIAIIVACALCLVGAHSTPAADPSPPGQTQNSTVVIPSVYLSHAPNTCFPVDSAQPLYLYLHAPDNPGLTSVSFDLQLQGPTVEPLLFLPNGVINVTSTPLGPYKFHLDVLLVPGTFDQQPIVQVFFALDPMLQGDQIVSNVVYNGGTPGQGIWTFAGCCVDCFYCSHVFTGSNTMQVPVGKSSTYGFEVYWHCHTSGGGAITVTDTEGWVTSWSPDAQGGGPDCGLCFWPIESGTVQIDVPDGVPYGTTSQMTIQGVNSTKNVTLEAIQSVPTEASTWGAVKALYQ